MTKPIPDALRPQIVDLDAAKAWIKCLCDAEMSWHFEDSPQDIVVFATGERLWTAEDAAVLAERRDELYGFDWGVFDCPIGYTLAYFRESGRDPWWVVGEVHEYENGHKALVVYVDPVNPRYAVLQKGDRFEPAYRDMEAYAEGTWTNPTSNGVSFGTQSAAEGRVATIVAAKKAAQA